MSKELIDYISLACIAIFGLVMILNPRGFMRGAKYDEDSIKTEGLVKKSGIAIIVVSIAVAIYFLVR